jgi:hypothetical protein
VNIILIFGFKLTEILGKGRGVSVYANTCFRKDKLTEILGKGRGVSVYANTCFRKDIRK